MRVLKISALAVTMALVLVSCCNCRTSKSQGGMSLTDASWQMMQIDGRAFIAKDASYTLSFGDEMKLSGRGDCNSFTGRYEIAEGNKISFGRIASTRMMCPDQESENKFIARLGSVDAYTIDGDMLMLFSNGEMIMALKSAQK